MNIVADPNLHTQPTVVAKCNWDSSRDVYFNLQMVVDNPRSKQP